MFSAGFWIVATPNLVWIGLNREHTDRQTHIHTFAFIYKKITLSNIPKAVVCTGHVRTWNLMQYKLSLKRARSVKSAILWRYNILILCPRCVILNDNARKFSEILHCVLVLLYRQSVRLSRNVCCIILWGVGFNSFSFITEGGLKTRWNVRIGKIFKRYVFCEFVVCFPWTVSFIIIRYVVLSLYDLLFSQYLLWFMTLTLRMTFKINGPTPVTLHDTIVVLSCKKWIICLTRWDNENVTGYRWQIFLYCLLLRGGMRPMHCDHFMIIVRPNLRCNKSWFIDQSSLENTSRDT
jgi:hypothetical protein